MAAHFFRFQASALSEQRTCEDDVRYPTPRAFTGVNENTYTICGFVGDLFSQVTSQAADNRVSKGRKEEAEENMVSVGTDKPP